MVLFMIVKSLKSGNSSVKMVDVFVFLLTHVMSKMSHQAYCIYAKTTASVKGSAKIVRLAAFFFILFLQNFLGINVQFSATPRKCSSVRLFDSMFVHNAQGLN